MGKASRTKRRDLPGAASDRPAPAPAPESSRAPRRPSWPPALVDLVDVDPLWRREDLALAEELGRIRRARDEADRWELSSVRDARRNGVTWARLATIAGEDVMTYKRRLSRMLWSRELTIRDLD
jgi:hypothetical protein